MAVDFAAVQAIEIVEIYLQKWSIHG